MTNVPAEIIMQGNNNAFFTTNAAVIYPANIQIFHTDGRYKFTDGVTQLSALPFLAAPLNYTPEDVANKSTNVNTDQASNTKYPSVKAVYDWAVGLFTKRSTLTTNYIPKATASDTIGNSSITDDGTDVNFNGDGVNAMVNWLSGSTIRGEINTNNANSRWTFESKNGYDIMMINGTTYVYYSGTNIRLATNNTDVLEITSGQKVNLPLLTASQIVETDASKNLVSAAKGTAYNKDFGTGTTNVVEIGSTLGNTKPLITSSAGKLQTSDWVNIVSLCTFVGWSSYTTQEVDVIDMGAYYMLHINVSGTSNSATTTIQLPYTTLSTNNGAGLFANNGTTIIGRWIFTNGSNTITFGVAATSAVWTASGTKYVGIDIFFKK